MCPRKFREGNFKAACLDSNRMRPTAQRGENGGELLLAVKEVSL